MVCEAYDRISPFAEVMTVGVGESEMVELVVEVVLRLMLDGKVVYISQ